MAKMYATEAAQRVIDSAVQLSAAWASQRRQPVERLYREIRALRIYEGRKRSAEGVIARAELAARGAAPKRGWRRAGPMSENSTASCAENRG